MAKKSKEKVVSTVNPIYYAHVVEFGFPARNIPARPLFAKTLEEYVAEFDKKMIKLIEDLRKEWK